MGHCGNHDLYVSMLYVIACKVHNVYSRTVRCVAINLICYSKLSSFLNKLSFYSVSKRWFAARDCYDLLRDGNNVSGVYEVYLAKARTFVRVFCDMDSNDGGWLVRTTQTQIHKHAHPKPNTHTDTHDYTHSHSNAHIYEHVHNNTHKHTFTHQQR